MPHGDKNGRGRSHGQTKTPEYRAWINMWQRCSNPSYPSFEHYKKLGIDVCVRWKTFENFLADVGVRPSSKHSIDRWPDNNGNYGPDNVRWATKQEQANNRRTNVRVIYRGHEYTLAELSRETGVSKDTINSRLRKFKKRKIWTIEEAIETPVRPTGR